MDKVPSFGVKPLSILDLLLEACLQVVENYPFAK
jgi:hypothetical protein